MSSIAYSSFFLCEMNFCYEAIPPQKAIGKKECNHNALSMQDCGRAFCLNKQNSVLIIILSF